jgi:hypothetical protein
VEVEQGEVIIIITRMSPARLILLDAAAQLPAELPERLVEACSSMSGCWLSLAVAAELPQALSYLAAAHGSGQAAMGVILPVDAAPAMATALWELDPELRLILVGSAAELAHFVMPSTEDGGAWCCLRDDASANEMAMLCAGLRREFCKRWETQQRLDKMVELVAERTAALSDSHMLFAMQFHETTMPQALFRYADGSCVDTNGAFSELTGVAVGSWKAEAMSLLNKLGLATALKGPHPRQAVPVQLGTSPKRAVMVYTQMVHFGSEACLLVSVAASPRAMATEPALHMALRS